MPDTSVIGSTSVVRGNVRGQGNLEILGKIEGDVSVTGDIVLGESAGVRGNLNGASITVAGQVQGDIRGTEAVLVEGHTDDRPISTSTFADNWALASARAINTYKALLAYEPSLSALLNERGEALLGVSNYEAQRPVSLGPTPQDRRLNRRIDLRFLIAAPSEAQLDAIRARMHGPQAPPLAPEPVP